MNVSKVGSDGSIFNIDKLLTEYWNISAQGPVLLKSISLRGKNRADGWYIPVWGQ